MQASDTGPTEERTILFLFFALFPKRTLQNCVYSNVIRTQASIAPLQRLLFSLLGLSFTAATTTHQIDRI